MKKIAIILFLLSIPRSSAQTIQITSYPVEMIRTGKVDIQVPASPPAGWEIEKVVIILRPVAARLSLEQRPISPRPVFEIGKPTTNTAPVPSLDTPKLKPVPPPAVIEKKWLKDLSLGEPKERFIGESPALLRISFSIGGKR